MSPEWRHVRVRGGDSDKRFRFAFDRRNITGANRGTFCGAPVEPLTDYSRRGAEHLIAKFAVIKPDWLADMCPACRAELEAVIARTKSTRVEVNS